MYTIIVHINYNSCKFWNDPMTSTKQCLYCNHQGNRKKKKMEALFQNWTLMTFSLLYWSDTSWRSATFSNLIFTIIKPTQSPTSLTHSSILKLIQPLLYSEKKMWLTPENFKCKMFHKKISQHLCRFWNNAKFCLILITCFRLNINHMNAAQNNEPVISCFLRK